MTKRSTTSAAIAVMAVLLAASCSNIVTSHGYLPLDSDLEQIEVGVTTSDEVLEIAGNPVVTDETYGETWLYIHSRFQSGGVSEPQVVSRQVVAISYSSEGLVSNVEEFGLEQGRPVQLTQRITETNEGRLTLVQQFFRGLGRLDPSAILDRDR